MKCCKSKSKYEIVYDCGDHDQTIHVCEKHYALHAVFRRNIKNLKELK